MGEENLVVEEKNLLVVYLDFPKARARSYPALILKYLVRLGWSVTIVVLEFGEKPKEVFENWSGIQFLRITPPLNLLSTLSLRLYSRRSSDIKVLHGAYPTRSPYSVPNFFWTVVNNVLNGFDRYYHFSRYVRGALIQLHEKKPFSAVMSVYNGPFTSHLLARQFARENHLPWVALVKDYWSPPSDWILGTLPPILRIFASIKLAFRRHVEAKVLRDADFLLPNCQPIADYLEAIVPGAQQRILLNCYDEEDFSEDLQPKVHANGAVFTALCLGKPSIIQQQQYKMFFDALRDLRTSDAVHRDSFRVKFVGVTSDMMHSYAEAYSCSDLVETLPQVSHEEAMFYLKQATCLLFPNTSRVLARRTPEYMAARKPILVFPWDDTSASHWILKMYGGAIFAQNSHEIAVTLAEWYRAFKAGDSIRAPIEEHVVQSFKASNRALELQEILLHVLQTHARNDIVTR